MANGIADSSQRLIVMTSQRADYYGELHANAALVKLTGRTGAAIEAYYRFVAWLVPTIERFPRSRKFTIGDRRRLEQRERGGFQAWAAGAPPEARRHVLPKAATTSPAAATPLR